MRTLLTFGLILAVATGFRYVPSEPPATGASSFTLVDAGRAAQADKVVVGEVGEPGPAKYTEDFTQARPLPPFVLPVYPPKALKAKAGRATVGVQVTVDAAGRVTDIGPSLLTFDTSGPFAADFLEAVQTAVRQWRFRPAETVQMELVQSGGFSYRRIVRTTATDTKLDLAFTFTASGGVETTK